MTNEILSEVGDGIATLTLNRPQRINAVNRAMVDQMSDILHAWADDDRVQQVRLAGAGERAVSLAAADTVAGTLGAGGAVRGAGAAALRATGR